MKLEFICDNEECPYSPPAFLAAELQYRSLAQFDTLDEIDEIRCPACASANIRVCSIQPDEVLFALGDVLMTPAVMAAEPNSTDVIKIVMGHATGQWDHMGEDAEVNRQALRLVDGIPAGRILTTATIGEEACWIITELGRQTTTILLPEEY